MSVVFKGASCVEIVRCKSLLPLFLLREAVVQRGLPVLVPAFDSDQRVIRRSTQRTLLYNKAGSTGDVYPGPVYSKVA